MKKIETKIRMKKGFTLIELLVVIAIIGILASVVLTSLSASREKAMDAKYKTTLASARAQGEIYYSDKTNYTGICNATSGVYGLLNIEDSMFNGSCTSTDKAWAMSGQLSGTNKHWCVDSTGNSTSTAAAATTTKCQ